MKSFDFDAIVYEGAIYCVGKCSEGTDYDNDPEVTPIFADSEHDFYPVCSACGFEHTYVGLTDDGRRAVAYAKVRAAHPDIDESHIEAAQGLHWYLAHHHSGQWSAYYRFMCELDYAPGALERDASAETNDWYALLKNCELDAEDLLLAIQEISRRS